MIIREKKNKSIYYTSISNHIFSDDRLSLRAKGLLCYMLSKPDNWNFYKAGIMYETGLTIKKLDNTLSELKKAGYLKIEQSNTKSGRFSYEFIIFENPP